MLWAIVATTIAIVAACGESRSGYESALDEEVRNVANFLHEGTWEPSDQELRTACAELERSNWDVKDIRQRLNLDWDSEEDRRLFRTADAIVARTNEQFYCSSWLE